MLKKWKKICVTGCMIVCVSGLFACGKQTETVSLDEAEKPEISSEKKEEKATGEKDKKQTDETQKNTHASKGDVEEKIICVYVCGCVNDPGVYELPDGSRIRDAVTAAGGMTEEAHKTCLNQALKVSDEEIVRVPTKENGDMILELEKGEEKMCDAMAEAGLSPTGVNINAAGKETLMSLPGIGASKADAIIAYRKKHNGFSSKEELMEVSGIGPGVFEKLEDKIAVK